MNAVATVEARDNGTQPDIGVVPPPRLYVVPSSPDRAALRSFFAHRSPRTGQTRRSRRLRMFAIAGGAGLAGGTAVIVANLLLPW